MYNTLTIPTVRFRLKNSTMRNFSVRRNFLGRLHFFAKFCRKSAIFGRRKNFENCAPDFVPVFLDSAHHAQSKNKRPEVISIVAKIFRGRKFPKILARPARSQEISLKYLLSLRNLSDRDAEIGGQNRGRKFENFWNIFSPLWS